MEEKLQQPGMNFGKLVGGVIVVAIGGMFLAEQLDLADLGAVFRWWPLILIGLGIGKLGSQPHTRERAGSGIWLIGIGAWLLISSLELWGFNYGNSWPLLLVFIGASMIARSFFPRRDCCGEVQDGRE